MPKKIKTTTTLIIVESPAKCKKIEEYLGPGYKCIASYGHLRTIPSLKNIDINNNFLPTYEIIDESIKKKQIEIIRKEIKKADDIMLSSDMDREGEMISMSIIELFNLPLNTKRITFNEITESALRTAIANPRTIDMDLVHSQQARQILDILVGFKVSPILWKLISQPKGKDCSLSAGRCQTPALKLVYDNQKDINESSERKVYNTTGYFTNSNLVFELNKEIEDEDDMIDFLDNSVDFSHIYTCSCPSKVFKSPPEPFTTSRIQQVASNELHYSPKETMRLCQILYEAGYITYMRTDSKVYSDEFIDLTKEYITNTYNAQYINPLLVNGLPLEKKKINSKKEENKKKMVTQDAHEAIRPTNISLQNLPEDLDSKLKRMYKLIWSNTLESCMATASYHSITANITAPLNEKYSYTSELIDFPGWKIVENKFSRENPTYNYLQLIAKDSPIKYKKICSKVSIKGSKMHYTEAKLVQNLEEKGIGRPSTFSSLIDKIQERGYVKKEDIKGKEIICRDFELEDREISEYSVKREFGNEKGKLVIQQLGIIVIELLEKYFSDIFNYEYTSQMEESLDKVAKGNQIWYEICSQCNIEIDNLINGIKNETKIEYKIDDNNTYLIGKFGPVIKCSKKEDDSGKEVITFKPVKKDIDLGKLEKGEYELNDIVQENITPKSQFNFGKYNDKEVVLRKGKFGTYVSWGEDSVSLKELGNRPIENITFEEIKTILDKGNTLVREITKSLSIRKGPKGDYLFYKDLKMKKPQFFDMKGFIIDTREDYKICNLTILKSWILEKYNIKI